MSPARNLCTYCRTTLARPTSDSPFARTREHLKPKCDGGTLTVPCCRRCNNDKGDLYLNEWIAILREAGDKRAKHVENVALLYPVLATCRYVRTSRPSIGLNVAEGLFICSFCGRRFHSKRAAERHARAIRHRPEMEVCMEAIVRL